MFFISIYSQDTIFLVSGVKKICKIQHQDSTRIYVTLNWKGQELNTSIEKGSVESIHYYNPNYRLYRDRLNRVNLSLGMSSAIGDFASEDNTETAGLAGIGFNINSKLMLYFNKNFGVDIKGYFNSNKFLTSKIADQWSSGGGYIKTNNVYYTSYGLLIGPSFIIPGNKTSFNGHFLIGYSNFTQPEATFTMANKILKMGEGSSGGIIINFGGGLIFSINKNFDFLINLDYMSAKYNIDKISFTHSNGYIEQINRGTQNLEVINITSGFGFKF